uniref:Uncharacterized protein n=1 Tax=Anguilla anguilla TaxID=7936 RepID=A0A0E9RKD4_ANGAN
MSWRCQINRVHGRSPNFRVIRGIDGRAEDYSVFSSLYCLWQSIDVDDDIAPNSFVGGLLGCILPVHSHVAVQANE